MLPLALQCKLLLLSAPSCDACHGGMLDMQNGLADQLTMPAAKAAHGSSSSSQLVSSPTDWSTALAFSQTPAVPLQQQKRLQRPHEGGVGAHGSPLKKKVALQQHQALAS
eukprot:3627-Heterococcus_DN1.PRE.1